MSVRVHMPPVLRMVCGGERWLAADGTTITGLMRALAERNPALRLHLFDEAGAIAATSFFFTRAISSVRMRRACAHSPMATN